jgi:hypothetical protein
MKKIIVKKNRLITMWGRQELFDTQDDFLSSDFEITVLSSASNSC